MVAAIARKASLAETPGAAGLVMRALVLLGAGGMLALAVHMNVQELPALWNAQTGVQDGSGAGEVEIPFGATVTGGAVSSGQKSLLASGSEVAAMLSDAGDAGAALVTGDDSPAADDAPSAADAAAALSDAGDAGAALVSPVALEDEPAAKDVPADDAAEEAEAEEREAEAAAETVYDAAAEGAMTADAAIAALRAAIPDDPVPAPAPLEAEASAPAQKLARKIAAAKRSGAAKGQAALSEGRRAELAAAAAAQTVAVTPPEEEEKCPDVQEMFAVTGLGASGTHYIAQLLDKAGVFMATGHKDCSDKTNLPRDACDRSVNDEKSTCTDPHYDYHGVGRMADKIFLEQMSLCFENADTYDDYGGNPANAVSKRDKKKKKKKHGDDDDDHSEEGDYQEEDDEGVPYGKDVKKMTKLFEGVASRAKKCHKHPEDNPWKDECVTRAGIKQTSLLRHLPTIAGVVQKVVLVVRDGRDLATGSNPTIKEYGDYWGMPSDGVNAVKVWSETNLQALACMQHHFKDNLTVVRIEDLMMEQASDRELAIAHLLSKLGLKPQDEAHLRDMAAIFKPPKGAPSNYWARHYGRWAITLSEEQSEEYYQAARRGLKYLGYNVDETTHKVVPSPAKVGQGARQAKVTRHRVDPERQVRADAAASADPIDKDAAVAAGAQNAALHESEEAVEDLPDDNASVDEAARQAALVQVAAEAADEQVAAEKAAEDQANNAVEGLESEEDIEKKAEMDAMKEVTEEAEAATEEHVEAAIAGEAEEDAASVVEVDEKEAAESAGAQSAAEAAADDDAAAEEAVKAATTDAEVDAAAKAAAIEEVSSEAADEQVANEEKAADDAKDAAAVADLPNDPAVIEKAAEEAAANEVAAEADAAASADADKVTAEELPATEEALDAAAQDAAISEVAAAAADDKVAAEATAAGDDAAAVTEEGEVVQQAAAEAAAATAADAGSPAPGENTVEEATPAETATAAADLDAAEAATSETPEEQAVTAKAAQDATETVELEKVAKSEEAAAEGKVELPPGVDPVDAAMAKGMPAGDEAALDEAAKETAAAEVVEEIKEEQAEEAAVAAGKVPLPATVDPVDVAMAADVPATEEAVTEAAKQTALDEVTSKVAQEKEAEQAKAEGKVELPSGVDPVDAAMATSIAPGDEASIDVAAKETAKDEVVAEVKDAQAAAAAEAAGKVELPPGVDPVDAAMAKGLPPGDEKALTEAAKDAAMDEAADEAAGDLVEKQDETAAPPAGDVADEPRAPSPAQDARQRFLEARAARKKWGRRGFGRH